MLVLTRKKGDSIIITCPCGTEIVVTIQETNAGRASVGVEAPKEVGILRQELKGDPNDNNGEGHNERPD